METKTYYQKNRKKILARRKQYRQKHREKIRTQRRNYYYRNKEKTRAYNKHYQQTHREELAACRKEYYQKNQEKILIQSKEYYLRTRHKRSSQEGKLKQKEYRQRYYQKVRKEVFDSYGGKCACCGEETSIFLCIDHINGKGNEHRKEIGRKGGKEFYCWLRRNKFPNGYRVLCFNCNIAFSILGYCPHHLTQV